MKSLHKKVISTFIFLFLLGVPNVTHGTGLTYSTEVKVKLLPISSISLNISGDYNLINLDSLVQIPLNKPVTVGLKDKKVTILTNDKTFSSTKGFALLETKKIKSNQFTVSKILTRSGPMDVTYRGSLDISMNNNELLLINRLSMDDYLKGVVASEMISSWPTEALKAQAVASRSYAYTQMSRAKTGYLESTVSSQVYGGKSNETVKSNQAVDETADTYPLYNHVPIEAFFHSSSGGHTENSENVWKNPLPYIKGVPDPYDHHKDNYHYGWETIGPTDIVKTKLNLSASDIILDLSITQNGLGPSVQQMQAKVFNSETKAIRFIDLKPTYASSSDSFRSVLGVSLKSINFTISTDTDYKIQLADGQISTHHLAGQKIITASGKEVSVSDLNLPIQTSTQKVYAKTAPAQFVFTGNGWGHLLGMSQWGARGMAEEGYKYDQILKHYYQGIEVGTWQPPLK